MTREANGLILLRCVVFARRLGSIAHAETNFPMAKFDIRSRPARADIDPRRLQVGSGKCVGRNVAKGQIASSATASNQN